MELDGENINTPLNKGKNTTTVYDVMQGERIFITGSTGSVGSVLLEKLLRCCPEIDKIFVLLRSKNGQSVNERIQKMFSLPLFATVSRQLLSKIVIVEGDVSLPDLGLNLSDRASLISQVGIVFHCAANVSFAAGLRSAVNTNLIGTKRVLQLCHHMQRIKSLVYVSTAYVNYAQREVTERLYPVTSNPNEVIHIVKTSTEEELKQMTKKLYGRHPNAYTFSKHLAEHLLAAEHGDIPLAIVRPSIVLGTWKEPFAGWLPISYGAAGFIAGAGKGVFRTIPASANKIGDFIPSDVVVNAIIASAWSLVQQGAKRLQVYHVTSSTRNPLTWGEYRDYVVEAWRDVYPCESVAWLPGVTCRHQTWRNNLAVRLFQLWPSNIVDFIEAKTSASHNRHKSKSLISIQKVFIRGMELTKVFSQRQWSFYNDNLCELHNRMTSADQDIYGIEILNVDWRKLINSSVLNIREKFFRDSISTLPKARANMQRWKIVNFLAQITLVFLLYWLFGLFLDGFKLFAATILIFLFFQWL